MKFITYLNNQDEAHLGIWVQNQAYDLQECAKKLTNTVLPKDILQFLEGGEPLMDKAREVERLIIAGKVEPVKKINKMLAPVPRPPSCRDGYAFRQHVATMRKNRGVEMAPEFDQFPIFYFTNHNAIIGEGEVVCEKDHFEQLDLELEAAIVIGKRGRNIEAKNADSYIAGFTIMNDFSARLLQNEEMKLSLGPAKGKDFATAIGPWLVTPDELTTVKISTPRGNQHNLRMRAWHNGKQISDGNLKDMTWSFAEIIERASYGTDILPGDVIGSGTVGTGCYAELNSTGKRLADERSEKFTPTWLKDGDTIELEIDHLGKLSNTIKKAARDYSILAKKRS